MEHRQEKSKLYTTEEEILLNGLPPSLYGLALHQHRLTHDYGPMRQLSTHQHIPSRVKRYVVLIRDFANKHSPIVVAICSICGVVIALSVAFGLPAMLLAALL